MSNIWQKYLNQKKLILALAPMAGYTDAAWRLICLENGADIVYTEMVSVEAIWRQNVKTLKMLRTLPQEKNVILQLFGSKPESFAKALQTINNLQLTTNNNISGIDINFGCPAHKVFKTGAGAALMNNKNLARQIIETVIAHSPLPISIKVRSQVKNNNAVEFVKYIKDLPIAAVMIHGRSLAQGFSGPVDFEMIRKVKKLLPHIPVLANGGVKDLITAQEMLEKTGADGLGLARGVLENPWLFTEIKKILTTPSPSLKRRGKIKFPPLAPPSKGGELEFPPLFKGRSKEGLISWPQRKKTMLEHAKLYLKYSDDLVGLRKHLLLYIKGQSNAAELRQKIIKVKDLKELEKILNFM